MPPVADIGGLPRHQTRPRVEQSKFDQINDENFNTSNLIDLSHDLSVELKKNLHEP